MGCLFVFGLMSYLVVDSKNKRDSDDDDDEIITITITEVDMPAELRYMQDWTKKVQDQNQPTLDTLMYDLDQALKNEDYEEASRIRDDIKSIQTQSKNSGDENQTK